VTAWRRAECVSGRAGCLVRDAALWALLALLPSLAWEVAQLPLYTLVSDHEPSEIVFAVVHCTVGDVLIATVAFLSTCGVLRRVDWPRCQAMTGLALVTTLSVAYTVWSEWHNVYQLGSWAYAAQMPLVYGIGLSPLLQWLVVPAVTLAWFRFLRRNTAR
jgi:hypothetical protein